MPGFHQRRSPAHPAPIVRDNRSTIIFLTVCTKFRRPILANEPVLNLLVDCWRQSEVWLVGRFVLMPDHLHLFCAPGPKMSHTMKQWVDYWQRQTARRWPVPVERPIWQRDCWDTQLRRHESYDAKWDYVRRNPCRHDLASDSDAWPYQGEIHQLEWHDE